MTDISVVVGYSDQQCCRFVIDFLETFEYNVADTVEYGFDCIFAVNKFNPDIVICDAFMYDLNVCQVIEKVKSMGVADPAFVVVTRSNISHFLGISGCRDISFYCLMPFDYLSFDKKLREIVTRKNSPPEFFKPDVFTGLSYPISEHSYDSVKCVSCIRNNLNKLGIPAKMRGYKYILESVLLALDDSEILYSLTKRLYPKLAKIAGVSSASVEHAIRVAIKYCWDNGNYIAVNNMFGSTVKPGGCPTNGQFISILTEIVKSELGLI